MFPHRRRIFGPAKPAQMSQKSGQKLHDIYGDVKTFHYIYTGRNIVRSGKCF